MIETRPTRPRTPRRPFRTALRAATLALVVAVTGCISSESNNDPFIPEVPQERGEIAGTVTDQQGSAVGPAEIRVTNAAGTVDRTTFPNEIGEYAVGDLVPGEYTLSITPPDGYELAVGFRQSQQVDVEGEETTRVDFRLVSDGT